MAARRLASGSPVGRCTIKTDLAVDTDTVLELLRRLPPRERLRVVVEVLPGLEDDLPPVPAPSPFWQSLDIETLAEQQGVQPMQDPSVLLGGWPDDESVDDFLAARQEWRQENLASVEDG